MAKSRNSAPGSASLQLSIGLTSNVRTRPLLDGLVNIDGVDLIFNVLHPSELFWRQLRFGDFDISEMSCSSLMMATAHGDTRWVGLPIFTTHRFFHTGILVRRDAGIETPADLRGKRVGLPEYQQTAAVWIRGAIEHEWGVPPKDMAFWMERDPSQSHGGATGFEPPPGVTVNVVPPKKSIGSMMLSGELDAALHYIVHDNIIDRSTADLWNHPEIKSMFPNPVEEGIRYFRKTGIYPINHGMVIKKELAERHPWVILNLMKGFQDAMALAEKQRFEHIFNHFATGMISAEAKKALHAPVLHHGVKSNRLILDKAADYAFEQGLTPRRVKLEEIFSSSTINL